jgi:hypothetical protein
MKELTYEFAIASFAYLSLKHFIADYLLQTDAMIKKKGYYGNITGMFHSILHGVLTFWWFFFMRPEVAIISGLFDAICHYHIDFLKVNLTKSEKLTPVDKDFWIFLGFDQYLHYMTYCLILKLF